MRFLLVLLGLLVVVGSSESARSMQPVVSAKDEEICGTQMAYSRYQGFYFFAACEVYAVPLYGADRKWVDDQVVATLERIKFRCTIPTRKVKDAACVRISQ